jgi:hypothetical protein
MPLTDVEVEPFAGPLPEAAMKYIEAGQIQVDHFHYQKKGTPYPAFIPSDAATVYRTLRTILETHLAPGRRFCEWGSGFGITAGLAAMLGFDACGIEIHNELVVEADRLAKHFGLAVDFVCGSLVPEGGEKLASRTSDFAWLQPQADDAYEQLGLEAEDFDVIFAYPWPGEEFAIDDLFERFAATGALLATYHGVQGMRVQRKAVAKRRR